MSLETIIDLRMLHYPAINEVPSFIIIIIISMSEVGRKSQFNSKYIRKKDLIMSIQ